MNQGFKDKIRKQAAHKGYHPAIIYYLEHFPNGIQGEELEKMVIRLRSGDVAAIRPIIETHLHKGVFIVNKFAYQFPSYIDDLMGQMTLSVTEAVNNAVTRLVDNNITPYILMKIWGDQFQYIGKQAGSVRIPPRTLRHMHQHGIDLPITQVPKQSLSLREDYPEIYDDNVKVASYEHLNGRYVVPETKDDHEAEEVMEVLLHITPDFIGKRVLELRAESYTYAEIAPQVGYSESTISIMVQTIEERYRKRKRFG